jgi:NTE family protein
VDTISTVSGGSILAAVLLDQVEPWPQPGEAIDDARWQAFANRVHELTRKNIRTLWFFKRLWPFKWFDSTVAVRTLARRYQHEFDDRPLIALPRRPRFIFSATDMSFGVNWVHERARVGSYQAGYAAPPPSDWTMSRAIAASSCFPPVFSPLPIDLDPEDLKEGEAKDHPDRAELINRLRLSDGGVYDNMGLEPVSNGHATVLVSDGGATLDFAPDKGFPSRLGRYLAVQSNQSGSVRKRWLLANFEADVMSGAYWGVGSARSRYECSEGYSKDLADRVISEIRTDLDYFSRAEQAVLENHGYDLADAAIARHLPDLGANVDRAVPHPNYLDEGEVERALARSHTRRLLGRWRWAPSGVADSFRRRGASDT